MPGWSVVCGLWSDTIDSNCTVAAEKWKVQYCSRMVKGGLIFTASLAGSCLYSYKTNCTCPSYSESNRTAFKGPSIYLVDPSAQTRENYTGFLKGKILSCPRISKGSSGTVHDGSPCPVIRRFPDSISNNGKGLILPVFTEIFWNLSVGSLEAEGLEFHPNICRRINHRISIKMESSNWQMNRANTAHSL